MPNTNLNVHFFEPLRESKNNHPWLILCDFDGTISLQDVTDNLLTLFGKPGYEELEQAWLNGEIGSRDCMSGQVALLDANKKELDNALSNIDIDPEFKSFVKKANQLGIQVKIISDGLDYAIKYILKPHGLDYLPIYANRLEQVSERRWNLEFPHSAQDCVRASGNCKCARVEFYQRHQHRVLFVGDGSSDFCASGKVDFVLSKDKLTKYCMQKNIEHLAINGFIDALDFITNKLSDTTAATLSK